jgi:transmembrane sensor
MTMPTSTPRPRREVIAEACEWFVEFRGGDELHGSRSRFDDWLRQSPENIQAYLEVAAAWSEMPTQDPFGRINTDALVERARSSRNDEVLVPFSSVRPSASTANEEVAPKATAKVRHAPRALAACIVLLAVAAATVTWLYNGVTYATGIGEQRTIRLSDSSLVDLNACSMIRVRFSRNIRTVQLIEGQALFHVAKDTHRPFIVRSDGMTVRAVGTEFDVDRKRTGTVVTVLEGRVAITGSDGEGDISPSSRPDATLSAGEQLTVTKAATKAPTKGPRTLQPRLADVSAATAWTQRRFVFEDTPLADVAEEFNRYSPRQLIIEDPELARRPISGIYSSTNPSSLIGFLSAQPELEVTQTEHEIRVTRR